MKLLFLDAYFEPEQIAFTHLEKDLLEGLVHEGHTVEIVCPTPTRGINEQTVSDYRKRREENLYNDRVHVLRFFAPRERRHPLLRALRYFWCNLRTYQLGRRIKKVDVVFANSTPPTQGWIAGIVAKKHKAPFVYSLQDVFPDSLVTAGMTQPGSCLWKIGRILESNTYKSCASIIVISEAMKENLLLKGVDQGEIQVISNWIDMNDVHPVYKDINPLFDRFSIDREKYIVLYAGNFGSAQGADIVLDAAQELQHETDIQFVLFGGGVDFQKAVDRAKLLSNTFIHPLLSQEKVSEVYSMGDVALITCKPGAANSGMPSKTWSIMACNTPIIASFDTESDLAEVLKKSGAGICVEPGNATALAGAIKDAYEKWKNEGKSSLDTRTYAIQNASKEICVKKYIDTLLSVAK